MVDVPLGLEPCPTIVVKRALRLLSAFALTACATYSLLFEAIGHLLTSGRNSQWRFRRAFPGSCRTSLRQRWRPGSSKGAEYLRRVRSTCHPALHSCWVSSRPPRRTCRSLRPPAGFRRKRQSCTFRAATTAWDRCYSRGQPYTQRRLSRSRSRRPHRRRRGLLLRRTRQSRSQERGGGRGSSPTAIASPARPPSHHAHGIVAAPCDRLG